MLRPLKAAIVSSTKPDSLSVSVWIATAMSSCSATDRQQSIVAGVVPQSSCSLSAQAPPSTISTSAVGSEALPLPNRPMLTGIPSIACSMRARCHGPGVQVVAAVPAGGRPRAAAEARRDPAVKRLLGELRANPVDMRVDAAGGHDAALAGDHLGARADHDIDAGLDVGVAGLADAADPAVADADIGFDDAPMVEDHGIGDDRIDGALGPAF